MGKASTAAGLGALRQFSCIMVRVLKACNWCPRVTIERMCDVCLSTDLLSSSNQLVSIESRFKKFSFLRLTDWPLRFFVDIFRLGAPNSPQRQLSCFGLLRSMVSCSRGGNFSFVSKRESGQKSLPLKDVFLAGLGWLPLVLV